MLAALRFREWASYTRTRWIWMKIKRLGKIRSLPLPQLVAPLTEIRGGGGRLRKEEGSFKAPRLLIHTFSILPPTPHTKEIPQKRCWILPRPVTEG